MSARPRPVTATFKPTCMEPFTSTPNRTHRRYSLSSGSSTESLISILDHDSYESPPESDEEPPKQKFEVKEKPERKDIDSFAESDNFSSIETTNVTTETEEESEKLSPWEQWLIRKTKECRIREKKERDTKKKQEEDDKKVKEEKTVKHKETEVKVQNWIERQNTLYKVKLKEQKLKKQTEEEVKQQKQKQIEEKSEQKYQEWQNKKHNEMKEKSRAEKQRKKEESEKKADRIKKNQEAFDEWCKKNKEKKKSAPQSFGYTQGKLTGYHDTNAYPIPSFYNPVPWQPIHTPQPKHDRLKKKKTTKKYAWNPKKYL